MYSIAHLVSLARSFSTVATRFLPETRLISVRIRLLRFAGATIEQYAKVIGYQAMTAPEDVFICEADYVNTGCLFLGGASINIKHHAMIGPRTNLVTINHTGENYNDLEFLPVTVEPYAWIGAGVNDLSGRDHRAPRGSGGWFGRYARCSATYACRWQSRTGDAA